MQAIIRPPSEAYSFILLAMLGCPNNTCTFCPTYKTRKFAIRDINEVIAEFDKYYRGEKKVFLADGDAIVIPNKKLVKLLKHIKQNDSVERISSYITPRTTLNKSLAELKELRENGLDLVYLGVETGNESLLKDVKKGVTRKEMIDAGKKIRKAGIKLSVTVILGLGGKKRSKVHAIDTASILNHIDPDYIGALTLMVVNGAEIYDMIQEGKFEELTDYDYLLELYEIIDGLELSDCIFRSNHASNYFSVNGKLPKDKKRMLQELNDFIAAKGRLKSEWMRGL